MKKVLLILCLAFLNMFIKAQTDLYFKIRNAINNANPEIITENKLISFSIWSIIDKESREANKTFDKAYSVYQDARLKGGIKGMVNVCINKGDLFSTAKITFVRDGITKSLLLRVEDIDRVDSENIKNMVFDSSGNEIYKNLATSEIDGAFNKLITR